MDVVGLYLQWHIFIKKLEYFLKKSQNHRIGNAGRHFWRSSGPIPVYKQGRLELVVQDHVQMPLAFEYLQGG